MPQGDENYSYLEEVGYRWLPPGPEISLPPKTSIDLIEEFTILQLIFCHDT